jgi:adenylosuccinate lyase
LYVTLGALRQRAVSGEVGSSTMPHKVNPIDFENAEGNLQVANALLGAMADKLSVSRLQRDLSDKTVKRNLGVALGHGLVAVESLRQGLRRVEPDGEHLLREVRAHPEVLSEALQLWLRARGDEDAFTEVLAQVRARGAEGWRDALASLDEEARRAVEAWQPEAYTGLAADLALAEADRVERLLRLSR